MLLRLLDGQGQEDPRAWGRYQWDLAIAMHGKCWSVAWSRARHHPEQLAPRGKPSERTRDSLLHPESELSNKVADLVEAGQDQAFLSLHEFLGVIDPLE